MEFRKTVESDLNSVMRIVRQAQKYFKENGIDQWQNNYPNLETIKNDIKNGYGYVLAEHGQIIGTVAVSFDGEKTYENIYDGQWLSNNEYAVIHRMAVLNDYKGKGISSVIMRKVEEMCLDKGIHSIKIDTHSDNVSMQRLILNNSFKYCGVIYLNDNSKRVAFEKTF